MPARTIPTRVSTFKRRSHGTTKEAVGCSGTTGPVCTWHNQCSEDSAKRSERKARQSAPASGGGTPTREAVRREITTCPVSPALRWGFFIGIKTVNQNPLPDERTPEKHELGGSCSGARRGLRFSQDRLCGPAIAGHLFGSAVPVVVQRAGVAEQVGGELQQGFGSLVGPEHF